MCKNKIDKLEKQLDEDNSRLILEWQRQSSKRYNSELMKKFTDFIKNQEDLDPEIVKIVDEKFWDLLL